MGWDDNNAGVGIWADFNDDKDFADPGEMLSDITWNDQNNTPGATGVINGVNGSRPSTTRDLVFTVPVDAAASFAIRIRSTDFGATMTQASAGGDQIDGETEDFLIRTTQVDPPSSNFVMPDSAFVGTVVNFKNSNPSYLSLTWTIDGNTYTVTNPTHMFAIPGTYDVKLVNEDCLGKDSTTKKIKVVAPTLPPASDFVSDKSVYEIFETIQFTDMSTNGPTFCSYII